MSNPPPFEAYQWVVSVSRQKKSAKISLFFQKPSGIDPETSQGCVSSPRLFPPTCEDSLRWKNKSWSVLFILLYFIVYYPESIQLTLKLRITNKFGFNWSHNENSINEFNGVVRFFMALSTSYDWVIALKIIHWPCY